MSLWIGWKVKSGRVGGVGLHFSGEYSLAVSKINWHEVPSLCLLFFLCGLEQLRDLDQAKASAHWPGCGLSSCFHGQINAQGQPLCPRNSKLWVHRVGRESSDQDAILWIVHPLLRPEGLQQLRPDTTQRDMWLKKVLAVAQVNSVRSFVFISWSWSGRNLYQRHHLSPEQWIIERVTVTQISWRSLCRAWNWPWGNGGARLGKAWNTLKAGGVGKVECLWGHRVTLSMV